MILGFLPVWSWGDNRQDRAKEKMPFQPIFTGYGAGQGSIRVKGTKTLIKKDGEPHLVLTTPAIHLWCRSIAYQRSQFFRPALSDHALQVATQLLSRVERNPDRHAVAPMHGSMISARNG